MGPSLAVEGSTNKALFETYIERVLCPDLKDGQVVVMDNLSSHKGEKVRELIEDRGCELVYLPAYSPDFNPIEEAFSKIKGILRKIGARTREAPARHSSKHWVKRSRRSAPRMPSVSSSIAATVARFNFYEQCCNIINSVAALRPNVVGDLRDKPRGYRYIHLGINFVCGIYYSAALQNFPSRRYD